MLTYITKCIINSNNIVSRCGQSYVMYTLDETLGALEIMKYQHFSLPHAIIKVTPTSICTCNNYSLDKNFYKKFKMKVAMSYSYL